MAKNKNRVHRYAVYLKSNFKCVLCARHFPPPLNWDKKSGIHDGTMWLEVDHIYPLSKGGSDDVDNKQALCQKCNNLKSDKI